MSESEQSRRLAERDAANARFGEELTRVDRALPGVDDSPATMPVAVDPARLRARLAAPRPAPDAGGWRGRLARFVWRLVAPRFDEQYQFNTAVIEMLEETTTALRRLSSAVPAGGAVERENLRAFLSFHSALMVCLQQIPPFVDTKTRAIEGALDEVRMAAVAAQRTALAVRRQLDRDDARTVESGTGAAASLPARGAEDVSSSARAAAPSRATGFGAGYVGFEDVFRGSEPAIAQRQATYVSRFQAGGPVVDVGCGRGEFLALLRDAGIEARGVDANPEMIAACTARGLQAVEDDGVSYVTGLAPESVGGITAFQVVEHLEPGRLVTLIEAAFNAIRPGGTIVLETINVTCWVAFFESYIRDITHIRPLHPETLKFLVVAAGFTDVDIEFRTPIDPGARLQTVDPSTLPPGLAGLAETLNRNAERLNDRLFTTLDYAVIGRRR